MSGAPVITGLAAMAATGESAGSCWKAAVEGVSGLQRISRFDTSGYPVNVAGEMTTVQLDALVDQRLVVQTDRWTQIVLFLADSAIEAAMLDLDALPPYSMGVVTAASAGGNEFGQREIERLWRRGPRHVGPYQSIAWFYAASTGQLSIRHGLRGPCGVVSTESAGFLDALAHARRGLRRGCAAMLVGASEAPLTPYSLTCHLDNGQLSVSDDPARAYLPFALDAQGYVIGEGGAVLVVEDREHALRRGAPFAVELAGHGATFAGQSPDRGSRRLADAIALALADAGVRPGEVDAIYADGMGVPEYDTAEAAALRTVFGADAERIPITAPKAGFGRTGSSSAGLDVTLAVLGIESGTLPPTPGLDGAALAVDLDLVHGRARYLDLRNVLVLARGYRGFQSAVLLRRTED